MGTGTGTGTGVLGVDGYGNGGGDGDENGAVWPWCALQATTSWSFTPSSSLVSLGLTFFLFAAPRGAAIFEPVTRLLPQKRSSKVT